MTTTLESLQTQLDALSLDVSNTVLPISTYDLHASDNEVRIHSLEISRQQLADSIQSLINLIQSLETTINSVQSDSDIADGTLQSEIDNITSIYTNFYTEYEATRTLLASLQFDLTEEISRVESDAFGNHNIALTQVGIVNNALQSAVVQLTTLESNFNTNVASVNQSLSTFATQASSIATDLTVLEAQVNNIDLSGYATVVQLDQAKVDIFGASASSFTNVEASYTTAISNLDSAVAADILNLDNNLTGSINTLDTNLSNDINTVDGRVDQTNQDLINLSGSVTQSINVVANDVQGVKSQYGVQVTAGSTTGGFAITGVQPLDGSGASTKFAVLADTFKIITNANDNGVNPFTVSGNQVKINGNLIVDGTIQADHIVSNSITNTGIYTGANLSSSGTVYIPLGTLTPGGTFSVVYVMESSGLANAAPVYQATVSLQVNGVDIDSQQITKSFGGAPSATTVHAVNTSSYAAGASVRIKVSLSVLGYTNLVVRNTAMAIRGYK